MFVCVVFFYLLLPLAVLHPLHKLEYFKNAGWVPDWIDTATKLVYDELERSYPAADEDSSVDEEEDRPQSVKICNNVDFMFDLILIQPLATEQCFNKYLLQSTIVESPREGSRCRRPTQALPQLTTRRRSRSDLLVVREAPSFSATPPNGPRLLNYPW